RCFFFSIPRPPPTSTLFPYTTLFRSYILLYSFPTVLAGVLAVGFLASKQYLGWFPASDLHSNAASAFRFLPGSVERESLDTAGRSEEHTSELQSRSDLVCRLLLEKKK